MNQIETGKGSFHTNEHILACLSSAPSNERIIRTAARMASAFNSSFTALFVETPDFAVATLETKNAWTITGSWPSSLGRTSRRFTARMFLTRLRSMPGCPASPKSSLGTVR